METPHLWQWNSVIFHGNIIQNYGFYGRNFPMTGCEPNTSWGFNINNGSKHGVYMDNINNGSNHDDMCVCVYIYIFIWTHNNKHPTPCESLQCFFSPGFMTISQSGVNCPRFEPGTYEGLSYSNTNKTHKLY